MPPDEVLASREPSARRRLLTRPMWAFSTPPSARRGVVGAFGMPRISGSVSRRQHDHTLRRAEGVERVRA